MTPHGIKITSNKATKENVLRRLLFKKNKRRKEAGHGTAT